MPGALCVANVICGIWAARAASITSMTDWWVACASALITITGSFFDDALACSASVSPFVSRAATCRPSTV